MAVRRSAGAGIERAGSKDGGRIAVGQEGESVAARYLERLGYTVRERNFRCVHGEIDLIVSDAEYLVFVEVKTRKQESLYHPTLAVTEDKKQRVRRLGDYYRGEHPPEPLQPRFDVVAVTLRPKDGKEPRVEHFVDAF